MKRILSIIFALILFVNLSAQQTKTEKINSYIEEAMKTWKMPGFAVAIVENDSVIFSKGFGIREINSERPVDKNTQFVTASCSKAFTTAALAILIDQNKMQWDDKVTKFIPTFKMYDPWVTNEMTIRDLVTHRSGLATFSGDFLWISSTYNPDEIINRAQYLKPVSSFRTKYGYQNIMFITAAQIIKAVTDSSWSEFLSAHILNKIGMNNSSTNYKEFYANENSAKGHYFKDDKAYTYKETQQDNAQGAIGINSSASDMAKWIKLQLAKGKFENTNIISEKQINEMWSNQFAFGNNNYGLGWFITYKNGKKLISHGGGMPGYISDVTLVPEEKFGFVILSNAETGMVNSVKNYIIDIMTNVEPKDYEKLANEGWTKRLERYEKEIKKREEEKVKNTKASLSLEKYCGVFEDKMYGNAEISIKNEKLFLQFNPTPTFRGELKHYQYDTYSIDWEDEFLTRGWLKFDFDFSGNVESFTMEVPNSPDFIFTELMFKKINKK